MEHTYTYAGLKMINDHVTPTSDPTRDRVVNVAPRGEALLSSRVTLFQIDFGGLKFDKGAQRVT